MTIEEQIERCRRLARYVSDKHLHRSLEELAAQFEAQLPNRSGGFMLREVTDKRQDA